MGTRAAAFTAKIRNLQDYHNRIQNGIVPSPSGVDVANTLKYFSQTLLSVLRDVPNISLDFLRTAEKDLSRTSLFPSLDYKSLYHVIVQFVDAVPHVQYGSHLLGQTVLHTLSCLLPFMEHEYLDTLPYTIASSMAVFPTTLHQDILDMICHRLLPFTIVDSPDQENLSYANMSTSAIMMMVFQYTDNSMHHAQLLECLMSLKRNVLKDLLCVIAYGTAKARRPAVELLFHYWPSLNPTPQARKALEEKHCGWTPITCQRETCQNPTESEAIKMSMDHTVSVGAGEHPPPLFMCKDCANQVTREHGSNRLSDVILPMKHVSLQCENEGCKSSQKTAVSTCFSIECVSKNKNRPIRYCAECNTHYHNSERGGDHKVQLDVPSPWDMDPETQCYMVEAIVSLLKEAQPLPDKQGKESGERHSRPGMIIAEESSSDTMAMEDRQLLSRYGVWLLVGLCTPKENTPKETLGRLLGMLFQWFHYTACLPDDQAGSALERLKAEYIHSWLMQIVKTHFEVFVACLLPHPEEYARVGGHWDSWPSLTNQIKEGFKRLLCLVPYDIITAEVWEYIMPYWMESFRHEVPEEELSELKILLSKVLDPDLSPLGFTSKQMYRFLSVRFEKTRAPVQEQALCWLQILTQLEVPVPLTLLFEMFFAGVTALIQSDEGVEMSNIQKVCPHPPTLSSSKPSGGSTVHPSGETAACPSDPEMNLTCFLLMLDILVKQLELQEVAPHKGLETKEAKQVMLLLRDMLKEPWVGVHTCTDLAESSQCLFCEFCALWYQLTLSLIEYFCPAMEVTMADIPSDPHPPSHRITSPVHTVHSEQQQESGGQQGAPHLFSEQPKTTGSANKDVVISFQELESQEQEVTDQPALKETSVSESAGSGNLPPIVTATVQECEGTLDTVAILPTEEVAAAFAHAVTLTEDDVAVAKCTIASATLVDENDQAVPPEPKDEDQEFWHTSQGKFKFTLDELPPQLQLVFAFLKELESHRDADVLYHLLFCLKLLFLHAEVLNKAARDHRGFLIWCQENLLVTNYWKLLQGEFSHISQLCVPLMLHCVTLPSGADVFWKLVQDDFHNENWRARFAAVERVTMIAHFVEPSVVKNSPLLQSSLANAFCYLVHCLDDINASVAQRALLNLETIKTPSLKLLVWCLEAQFDIVILDRPMILQTIFQLYNHLSDRRFLNWDFFLNRFDALFLEAQINLERTGEITYTRDLKNTNLNSEMFQRKLNRAHEALTLTHTSRSLTASIGTKWPYKRAMSAPGGMLSKQEKLVDKEKIYNRQSSAPVLKRKSSKLMGGPFSSGTPSLQHLPNSFFPDGHLKEAAQEESHFLHVIHRVMELEDHDRDTMHLLIFLLMQFLSRPDYSHPIEEKGLARNQHIVLRHLNVLLGYSSAEKGFLIPPYKLRASPVFNAFVVSMPKVLDYNFKMGNIILGTCLPVLIYCPAAQRYASEHVPPNFSLWNLKPHIRHSWLMAVLVILYKYPYSNPPQSKQVQNLIHILMNTLECHFHRCKPLPEAVLSPVPSRSRDLSTASVDLGNIQEQDTPPMEVPIYLEELKLSIGGGGQDTKASYHKPRDLGQLQEDANEFRDATQARGTKDRSEKQWKSRKLAEFSCSSDGEDEPELEAIPESPKSENSEVSRIEELHHPKPTEVVAEQARVRIVRDAINEEEKLVITGPLSKQTGGPVHVVQPAKTVVAHPMSLAIPVTQTLQIAAGGGILHSPQLVRSFTEMQQPTAGYDSDADVGIEKSLHESMEKSVQDRDEVVSKTKGAAKLILSDGLEKTTRESEKPSPALETDLIPAISSPRVPEFHAAGPKKVLPGKALGDVDAVQMPLQKPKRGEPSVGLQRLVLQSPPFKIATDTICFQQDMPKRISAEPSKPTPKETPLQQQQVSEPQVEKKQLEQRVSAGSDGSPKHSDSDDQQKSKPKIQRMGAIDKGSLRDKTRHEGGLETAKRKSPFSHLFSKSVAEDNLIQESPTESKPSFFSTLRGARMSAADSKKKDVSSPDKKAQKSPMMIDALAPVQIPPLPKPNPERLLPIGPSPKLVRTDSLALYKEPRQPTSFADRAQPHKSLEATSSLETKSTLSSTDAASFNTVIEVDKAVQTCTHPAKKEFELVIPTPERLLPVGPPPFKRDADASHVTTPTGISPLKPMQQVFQPPQQQHFVEKTKADEKVSGPFFAFAKEFPSPQKHEAKICTSGEAASIESGAATIKGFPPSVEHPEQMADLAPTHVARRELVSITESELASMDSNSIESGQGGESRRDSVFTDTLPYTLPRNSIISVPEVSSTVDTDAVEDLSISTNSSNVSQADEAESKLVPAPPPPSIQMPLTIPATGLRKTTDTAREGRLSPRPKSPIRQASINIPVFQEVPSMTERKEDSGGLFRSRSKGDIHQRHLDHQGSGGSDAPPTLLGESTESRDGDDESSALHGERTPSEEAKGRLHYRQRKQRKTGVGTVDMQRILDGRTGRRVRKSELGGSTNVGPVSKRSSTSQSSSAHYAEEIIERCNDCGSILEEYTDEELGLCIVNLAAYIHREPTLASPLLPEILRLVSRIASNNPFPWQCESNVHLPGAANSIARQFLRCTLHQLAPNGIFLQIFHSNLFDADFFRSMAVALADFVELNQLTPLILLFENLNERKHIPHDTIYQLLENVAMYFECLPLESSIPPWGALLQLLEAFLRKLLLALPAELDNMTSIIRIMLAVLKLPVINAHKSLLDPFSKLLSHTIQHSPLKYQHLLELCHLCNRNFTRERDKQVLSRTVVFELVQALKFKTTIPDENLLMLVQFILQDAGGTIGPTVITEDVLVSSEMQNIYNTNASECMRQSLHDALEFIADVHTLSKVKSNFHGASTRLNEETLGGQLKAGIAQYLALEITKGNGRDNRAILKYLPWLYHPPSTLQQGPKEFIDCVAHIRLLSWLLLGALMHSALLHNSATLVCQPIPLEANGHIAEHIQVILAGFAEQSKASVLHMSSLFHAFILCQLWTMYCEHMVSLNPPGSEQNQQCSLTLFDFWTKVTPSILQLVCHSKVLAEMVSLHFLSLMEALMECNSTVLARLIPMWTPVFYSYHGQVSKLPGHLQVRLQACLNWQPPAHTREEAASITSTALKWLQRLQFKMGQIEMQSSAATQFYSV